MFEVVEIFGSVSVNFQGRQFITPSLVEDVDGSRALLVGAEAPFISGHAWMRASAGGALAIVRSLATHTEVLSASDFMQLRTEQVSNSTFGFPGHSSWNTVAPSWRIIDMLMAGAPPLAGKFVHLHTHSDFSSLDGLSTVEELVDLAIADEQPALAITDHGVCASHPDLQRIAQAKGIKPIFGIEAYFVNDRFDRHPANRSNYWHLILWAATERGLYNLWAASTEANRTGSYYRPRMDWDVLERFSEGVMCSTACLRGPVTEPLLRGAYDEALLNLGKLQHIFDDRLWVELHTNVLEEQHKANLILVEMAQGLSLPSIAVVDSHYPSTDHSDCHKVWIAAQTNKDLQDEADLFSGSSDYHLMTSHEVGDSLLYLPASVVEEAMAQTLEVARRCDVTIKPKSRPPVISKGEDGPAEDTRRIVDICISNWHRTAGKRSGYEVYAARFEREIALIASKGFSGYFLMVSNYCRWARSQGILIGPGRGSGGGCLVAWLLDITSIDPVDADLIFERFLTEGRTALPDFDVDFPTSKRDILQDYIVESYGDEHVVRVGSQIRFKSKGVIRTLARVLKSTTPIDYVDINAISRIIDAAEAGEAGLGMSWEKLWVLHEEELAPYLAKYPDLFRYADQMVGRISSYGRHAAGVVISTDSPLEGRLPMRRGEGDMLISEYSFDVLEWLGLVKFDLLTLRTLDTIQVCVDLIEERTGKRIEPTEFREELEDPRVWEEISNGNTLGMFQIETSACTRLCRRLQPQSISDLSDVIALVRPGPTRSGLTESYLRRRSGQEAVSFPHPSLEGILAKTYGTMIYQEDVMSTCMVLAGYDSTEADGVRKLLGKKQVEQVAAAGQKFTHACAERGVDPEVAARLWEQMAEFAKYVFNRAHSWGYSLLGHWTAWLKVNYPGEFMTALLSTVKQERIPEVIRECRRLGLQVRAPDINLSGRDFALSGNEVLYSFAGVKGIGSVTTDSILSSQPYADFEDFLERKTSKVDSADVRLLSRIGAFDSMIPNRRALEAQLEWEGNPDSGRCVDWNQNLQAVAEGVSLPCDFDWAAEPAPVSEKTGKPLKKKPPPKKCTKACRNYRQRPTIDFSDVPPYTPADIRDIEADVFGLHITSTRFDEIPEGMKDQWASAEQIELGDPGEYLVIGVVAIFRNHVDRSGRDMAFLEIELETGTLDLVCFASVWKTLRGTFRQGSFVIASVHKNDRGVTLNNIIVC